MIGGMREQQSEPQIGPMAIISLAALALLIIGPGILALSEYLEEPFLGFWICKVTTFAAGTLALIRWINDRDDPRRAKRPPDAP